ncbi:CCSMST1 family domain-containing protein [Phthorimaea operculella]|nr:CCSMST1 family domain-containing protein [Phthorimaea operculella]
MNRNLVQFSKLLSRNRRCLKLYSTQKAEVELDETGPVKFSTSQAARKTVRPVVRKVNTDMPWYQPYSVIASVTVFMLYFCVFREENDVDKEFTKTLYERIKGLEKEQLLQSYKFNKEHGKPVAEIEARLKELEAEEAKALA